MTWILIAAILTAGWAILRLLGSERQQSLAALEYRLIREHGPNPAANSAANPAINPADRLRR